MHILIFEPDVSGHHLNYVRLMLAAVAQLPAQLKVTLVVGVDAPTSPEFQTHLGSIDKDVHVDPSIVLPAGTVSQVALAKLKALRSAVERHGPDHVWIPYADGMTQVAGLRGFKLPRRSATGPIEYEALMMRGRFAYHRTSLKDRAINAVSLWSMGRAPWDIIHQLDPIPYELIRERGGRLARINRVIPEPIDPMPLLETVSARRQLGIPEDGFYLGVTGLLDERKGVDRLIWAMDAVPKARLLLAGSLSPQIRDLLAGPGRRLVESGQIQLIDRYLSHDEFLSAFAATDVICTLYPDHIGSASIAIRAAAAGKPVLSSNFGWLGHVVPRFDLGWTCDVTDDAGLRRNLSQATDRPPRLEPSESRDRFLRFHTNENFGLAWTRRIRERLGLPSSSAEIRWDWVTAATADRHG